MSEYKDDMGEIYDFDTFDKITVEYRTIHLAAHTNPTKRLNELAKEGWRVVCSYGGWRLILCRHAYEKDDQSNDQEK